MRLRKSLNTILALLNKRSTMLVVDYTCLTLRYALGGATRAFFLSRCSCSASSSSLPSLFQPRHPLQLVLRIAAGSDVFTPCQAWFLTNCLGKNSLHFAHAREHHPKLLALAEKDIFIPINGL
jgi:hypothetical protein